MIDRHALDFLIERAEKSRNEAGRDLAEQRQVEQQLQGQLSLLRNYHKEYRQRLQSAMVNGVSLLTIRDYQGFIKSLESAIANAEEQLKSQQRSVEQSQGALHSEQRKLSSFDTLAERRKQLERSTSARREQKQSDELINNTFARRSQDSHSGVTTEEGL